MRWIVTCSLCFVLFGCGGGDDLKMDLAPVSGVVTVDGQPVKKPVVTFYGPSGPPGVGVGNENGEFTIKTSGHDGAPIGKCKVTVTVATDASEAMTTDGNEAALAKEKGPVDAKFSSAATTPLSVDVPKEGKPDVKLEVTAG